MKQKHIPVTHSGLTINIKPTRSKKKNGCVYKSYQIDDYSTGERKRLTFSDLEEAKKAARDLAENKATGKRHTLDWDAATHAQIRRALALSTITGLPLDHICQVFMDAAKVLGGDHNLILPAAYFFKDNSTQKVIVPMKVNEGALKFLKEKAPDLSLRREATQASYMRQFKAVFADRIMHEIQSVEVHDWIISKEYSPATYNDVLNFLSQFFRWGSLRSYVALDPCSSKAMQRKPVKRGDIGIFIPSQARLLFSRVRDDLKPFLALWCFTGLRKDEAARVTWEQVDEGLASGSIYLPGADAKPGVARAVPLAHNLKEWLLRYRQNSGLVLPEKWRGHDAKHQLQRLDDLTGYLTRHLGFWRKNAPRHSFATYHLALHKDAAKTVQEMGTSLQKLQEHYWARSKAITTAQAVDWFSITPETDAVVVPLNNHAQTAVG